MLSWILHGKSKINELLGPAPCLCETQTKLLPTGNQYSDDGEVQFIDTARAAMVIPLHESGRDVPIHHIYEVGDAALGKGTYGEVRLALQKKSKVQRAVKILNKGNLGKARSAYIWRELDLLRSLDHPNVIRLYESYQDKDFMYLVLELCTGGDLLEFINDRVPRMPERECAQYSAQIVAAINHIHAYGIVHRDVKPENFLFTRGEPDRKPFPPKVSVLKLIDFGLSKKTDIFKDRLAVSYMTPRTGTWQYMAPEMVRGTAIDGFADRGDMWSVGVIIHIMLTGHFPNVNLAQSAPDFFFHDPYWNKFSLEVKDLLRKLLHYDVAQRSVAAATLRHGWLLSAVSELEIPGVASNIPDAIRSFKSLSVMSRVLLVSMVREVSDRDAQPFRRVFQQLEFDCAGALHRFALRKAAERDDAVGATAQALVDAWEEVNTSQRGVITWSEFAAAALCQQKTMAGLAGRYDGKLMAAIDEALGPEPHDAPIQADVGCGSESSPAFPQPDRDALERALNRSATEETIEESILTSFTPRNASPKGISSSCLSGAVRPVQCSPVLSLVSREDTDGNAIALAQSALSPERWWVAPVPVTSSKMEIAHSSKLKAEEGQCWSPSRWRRNDEAIKDVCCLPGAA